MKKILLLMVGVLLVIGLIGVGTFAISQDVEAGTAPPEPFFYFIDLVISPTEVDIGQIVTISTTVINSGDKAGSHEVTLKIDGVVEATKVVTLEILEEEEVTFTISKNVASTYSVAVDGLTGSFTVKGKTAPVPSLVAGIIAAVVVVVILAFFLVRRKAA